MFKLSVIIKISAIVGLIILVIFASNVSIKLNDTLARTVTDTEILYFNSTEYLNTTVWVNSTVYINTTTAYPFIDGWNNTGSTNYLRVYKQFNQAVPYRYSFYNQITNIIENVGYGTLSTIRSALLNHYNSGAITAQQYDCANVQLYILIG